MFIKIFKVNFSRCLAICCFLFSGNALIASSQVEAFRHWKEFESSNEWHVKLPSYPKHLHQVIEVPGGESLAYDIYLSTLDRHAAYIILSADATPFLNQSHGHKGLENILNHLMNQKKGKLISARLIEEDRDQGMDFFIDYQGIYFRGRVWLTPKKVYLLGMESNESHYPYEAFDHFVNSFKRLAH
ncbi:MAG: hypothetical protein VXZ72_00310 [Chlamydiota bacterium]|nr:hypothetical protein [Chlamydiota bacterium]